MKHMKRDGATNSRCSFPLLARGPRSLCVFLGTVVLLVMHVTGLYGAGKQDPSTTLKLADGTEMQILFSAPKGVPPYPLALMLPGGAGQLGEALGSFDRFAKGFNRLGYCIVVPISKDDKGFVNEKAQLILKLHDKLKADRRIAVSKTILGGVSRGGAATLEIAAMDAARFKGLMLVPGVFYKEVNDMSVYTNKPVFVRIGANDRLKWNETYPMLVDTLKRSGAVVDAKLLPGEGHVFEMNWVEVGSWLKTIK